MEHGLQRREFSCSDFDELCQLTRGWALDFAQLNSGRSFYHLVQLGSEKALFSAAYFDAFLRQRGEPPPNMITFAIPAKGCPPFFWRGYFIDSDSIMVFTDTTELFSISQFKFNVYTYSYCAEELAQIAERYDILLPTKFFSQPFAYVCDPKIILNIQRLSKDLCRIKNNEGAHTLHVVAPQILLTAVGTNTDSCSLFSSKKRRAVVKRVDDFLYTNIESPITIKDLCRIAQVSERTLQYAFVEGFGLTPQQYLKRIRLSEAYKRLRRSKEIGVSIRSIAKSMNLSHSGQFARDYKEYFGELPSETVIKSIKK